MTRENALNALNNIDVAICALKISRQEHATLISSLNVLKEVVDLCNDRLEQPKEVVNEE